MELESRFGFSVTPFTREIEVQKHFHLPMHDEVVRDLSRTIEKRMSAALIAPAGTGKTQMLRAVRAKLPEARYRVTYAKLTNLSTRDMCREISQAIGARMAGNFPSLVRNVQERLSTSFDSEGLRQVVLLDDCHEMRPSVLSIIRLLTNFDMDSRLVVSFVLAGQPPLRTMLQREELEDVARRINHYSEIRLLSRPETKKYLQHRCTVAGAKKFPFDDGAVEAVYEVTRGNLRAIDAVALKAMEVASDTDCEVIDQNHILEAKKRLWP